MKTFSLVTLTLILSVYGTSSHAQSWELNGNATTNPNNNFVGTTDNRDLRFRTDNTFRMGLTGVDGFLGINTTAPASRFHMVDGAFVVSGFVGSNPDLGLGTRMMWIPDVRAFRAGYSNGLEWDAANVGADSFVFGSGSTASGAGSVSFGDNNTVSGIRSYAFGSGNVITNEGSFALGNSHQINGTRSLSSGVSNIVNGDFATTFGTLNSFDGNFNFGAGKLITLHEEFSMALGCFIHSTESGNITLGSGTVTNNLLNDIENCLMVGFNSDLPTLFVENANGVGTTGRVGIGTTALQAKLHIAQVVDEGNNFGVIIEATNGTIINGARIMATGNINTTESRGVNTRAANAAENTGVFGFALNGEQNIGVAGVAVGGTGSSNYGLYGEGTTNSAYFTGVAINNQPPLFGSDQQFKSNVTDDVPGLDVLQVLAPKAYNYQTEEFPNMHFGEGVHFGFIAQEVQEVLPNIVHTVSKPTIRDEDGEIISEGLEHLAMDYTALIPILIKSVQEQQAMIAAQQEQIELLTSMVSDCCTNNDAKSLSPNAPSHQGDSNHGFKLDVERPALDQNIPNPFTHATRITFRLPQPTFARLKVVNANGHLIDVLAEGQMPEGEYHVNWNGEHLAPGTYLYVLEANGIEIVKRAVKMH